MARGSTFLVTAPVGNRRLWSSILSGSPTVMAVTGFTPTVGGIGARVIPGAGRHSIMDAGSAMLAWAGAGPRIRFGGPPGFAGGIVMPIAAGRPCLRAAPTAPVWG